MAEKWIPTQNTSVASVSEDAKESNRKYTLRLPTTFSSSSSFPSLFSSCMPRHSSFLDTNEKNPTDVLEAGQCAAAASATPSVVTDDAHDARPDHPESHVSERDVLEWKEKGLAAHFMQLLCEVVLLVRMGEREEAPSHRIGGRMPPSQRRLDGSGAGEGEMAVNAMSSTDTLSDLAREMVADDPRRTWPTESSHRKTREDGPDAMEEGEVARTGGGGGPLSRAHFVGVVPSPPSHASRGVEDWTSTHAIPTAAMTFPSRFPVVDAPFLFPPSASMPARRESRTGNHRRQLGNPPADNRTRSAFFSFLDRLHMSSSVSRSSWHQKDTTTRTTTASTATPSLPCGEKYSRRDRLARPSTSGQPNTTSLPDEEAAVHAFLQTLFTSLLGVEMEVLQETLAEEMWHWLFHASASSSSSSSSSLTFSRAQEVSGPTMPPPPSFTHPPMPMADVIRPTPMDPPTAFTILHTWLSWSERTARPPEAHACAHYSPPHEKVDHRNLEEEEEGRQGSLTDPQKNAADGQGWPWVDAGWVVVGSPLDRCTMSALQSMVFRTAALLLHHARRFLSWYTLQAWKRKGGHAARMNRSSPSVVPEWGKNDEAEEEEEVVGSSTNNSGGGFTTDALTWEHLWPFLPSPHHTSPPWHPSCLPTSPTRVTHSNMTWEKSFAAFTVDTFAMWCGTAFSSSPPRDESRTLLWWSPSRSSSSCAPSSFFPFFSPWCGRGYALGSPLLDTLLCATALASTSSSAVGGSASLTNGERRHPHHHHHSSGMGVAVRMGFITELSGEAGSGKTQWLLQLLCMEAARHVVCRAVWRVGMEMMTEDDDKDHKKKDEAKTKSDSGGGGGRTDATTPRRSPSFSRRMPAETNHPPKKGDAKTCPTGVPSGGRPTWKHIDWKRHLAAWESDVFARLPSLRGSDSDGRARHRPVPPSPLPRPLVYLVAEDLPMPRLAQIAAGCIRKMIALYFDDDESPPCRPAARRQDAPKKNGESEHVHHPWQDGGGPIRDGQQMSDDRHPPTTPNAPPRKKKKEEDTTPLMHASGSSFLFSLPFRRPTPPPLFFHGFLPYPVVSQWKKKVQQCVTVADVLSTILIYKIRNGLQELHDLVQMGEKEAYNDNEEEEKKKEETREDHGIGSWRRKRKGCGELVKLFRNRHAFLVQSDKEAGERGNEREWEVQSSGGLVIIDSIAAAAQQSRLAEDEKEEEKKHPRRPHRKMERHERGKGIEEDAEDDDHLEEEAEEEEEEEEEGVLSLTPRSRRHRASVTQATLLREVGVGLRGMSQAFGVAVIVSNQVRSVFSPPRASSFFDAAALDAREWREPPLHPIAVEEAERRKMREKGENTREDTSTSTTTRIRSLSSPTKWFSMISSSFSSSTTTTPLGLTWASIPHVRLRLYRERFPSPTTTSTTTMTRASLSCDPTRTPRTTTTTLSSSFSNRTMMTITNGTIARPSVEEKDGEREMEKDAIEPLLPTSSSSGFAAGVPPRSTDFRWVEVCQSPYLPKGLRIPFEITTDGVEGVYIESYVGCVS